jgi:hypothetical protein
LISAPNAARRARLSQYTSQCFAPSALTNPIARAPPHKSAIVPIPTFAAFTAHAASLGCERGRRRGGSADIDNRRHVVVTQINVLIPDGHREKGQDRKCGQHES